MSYKNAFGEKKNSPYGRTALEQRFSEGFKPTLYARTENCKNVHLIVDENRDWYYAGFVSFDDQWLLATWTKDGSPSDYCSCQALDLATLVHFERRIFSDQYNNIITRWQQTFLVLKTRAESASEVLSLPSACMGFLSAFSLSAKEFDAIFSYLKNVNFIVE